MFGRNPNAAASSASNVLSLSSLYSSSTNPITPSVSTPITVSDLGQKTRIGAVSVSPAWKACAGVYVPQLMHTSRNSAAGLRGLMFRARQLMH
jgi:hypothetical protein